MKKKRTAASMRQTQYAVAGALVVLAVVGMTWFYTSQQAKIRQEKEQQLAREAAEAKEEQLAEAEARKEELAEASKTVVPQQENTLTAQVEGQSETEENGAGQDKTEENGAGQSEAAQTVQEETKNVSKTQDTLHFSAEEGLTWPLQGDVILGYNMDQTVYFATLEQYKYNPAILIAGEVNSKVLAAAQGKVTDISENEVTGCTVTMDLGDGYTAVYGQLKELNFEVGDLVEEGQVIGHVSEPTKYFSVEGSNLYFEVQKDGVPQDPMALIGA